MTAMKNYQQRSLMKRSIRNIMSNLSDVEQRVLNRIKHRVKAPTADDLRFDLRHTSYGETEVRQAIVNLVSLSFISMGDDGRYHAVGKEL